MHTSDGIYLLMSETTYQAAMLTGQYAPGSLQSEGFIHASPKDQLSRVANKHYREYPVLYVVTVLESKIASPVKWEPAAGGLYPHIYGPLNMDAVVDTILVTRDEQLGFAISI